MTYSLAMQPVLAFVGGLEFDLLPGPLVSLETEVCWPEKQPGVDLSVLRTQIRSGGALLLRRTLRLAKRFGTGTGFKDNNVVDSRATWRERNDTLEPMSRTPSLLEGKFLWECEAQQLYLASAEYGKDFKTLSKAP